MWPGQNSGKICCAAGWSGTLTAAEQGLVHEPDVGEALLARLRDAHLVAGEHVPVVLLDLGAEGEGAEQPLRARGCSFTTRFLQQWVGKHTLSCVHSHNCTGTLILTARSCFRFFF